MADRLLKIEEVAFRLGVSTKTINNWYWYKNRNPEVDNEYIKMLPDYIQEGERQTRFWKESDLPILQQYKESIPRGRSGIMGSVTQKYLRNRKKENEAE